MILVMTIGGPWFDRRIARIVYEKKDKKTDLCSQKGSNGRIRGVYKEEKKGAGRTKLEEETSLEEDMKERKRKK